MTKKKPGMRLGVMLVMCTLFSGFIAACAFFGLESAGEYLIDRVIYTKEAIRNTEKALFNEFLDHMNVSRATLSNKGAIQAFVKDKDDLMLAVYDAQVSYLHDETDGVLYTSVSDALAMYDLLQDEYADYWYSCPVMSSGDIMRSRVVKVMYFPMYRAKTYAMYVNLACSFLLFVGVLYAFIRGKMRYIALLSRELQAIEGGDLLRPMTVKGRDELTSLARDIENMRLSFIERLENEERMTKNASELLTAMSHDLRTPLTSLIGYLDIVDLGKCANPEQAQRYIHSGKLKAYQIKEMTDKLFEYFLVYSSADEEMETETLDAAMLFGQLWEESAMALESDGFAVTLQEAEGSCAVKANPTFLRRVFDNLVSNIRKYADREEPVIVILGLRNGAYQMEVRNGLKEKSGSAESSGIGLASCRKIMESHGGVFETEERSDVFIARISLPGYSDRTLDSNENQDW